jgi:hypothetical protein
MIFLKVLATRTRAFSKYGFSREYSTAGITQTYLLRPAMYKEPRRDCWELVLIGGNITLAKGAPL